MTTHKCCCCPSSRIVLTVYNEIISLWCDATLVYTLCSNLRGKHHVVYFVAYMWIGSHTLYKHTKHRGNFQELIIFGKFGFKC